MTGVTPVVVYVVRENPESALDEFVAVPEVEVDPAKVQIIRELGEEDGKRYIHACLRQPVPAWDGGWRLLTADDDAPFAPDLVRHRVVAYVTRERYGQAELLTIEPEDWPEPFREVPAGRLEHGETLEDGLVRELAEETGFTGVRIVRELPDFECTYRTHSHNHAFHLVAVEETAGEWRHEVAGEGADAGMVHICRWVPLSEDLELWNAHDPMLTRLLST